MILVCLIEMKQSGTDNSIQVIQFSKSVIKKIIS